MARVWKHKIKLARKHLGRANHQLAESGDPERIVRDLEAACFQIQGAWLMKSGHGVDRQSDQDTIEKTFSAFAPSGLNRKISFLHHKLLLLGRSRSYDPDPGEDGKMSGEQWVRETRACLREIAAFGSFVLIDRPLEVFRGEQNGRVYFDCRPGMWVQLFEEGPAPHPTATGKVLDTDGQRVILRVEDREIRSIDAEEILAQPLDQTPDDMKKPFEQRRTWFDLHPEYRQIPLKEHPLADMGSSLFFTCPCCGYPTLHHHPTYCPADPDPDAGVYSICLLCDWADDWGQDDLNAEDLPGRANFDYTLAEARSNFQEYLCMFRPGHDPFHSLNTAPESMNAKESLRELFDRMVGEQSPGTIYLLWHDAEQARTCLYNLLKEMEQKYLKQYTTLHSIDGIPSGRVFENKWNAEPPPWRPGQWVHDTVNGLVKLLWIGRGPEDFWTLARHSTGSLRQIIEDPYIEKPAARPDDAVTLITIRRDWFDVHRDQCMGHATCPCCGFPTQEKAISHHRCFLCQWLDDGQDDLNAGEVHNRENGTYSLEQARENMMRNLTMFSEDDPAPFARTQFDSEAVTLKKQSLDVFYTLLKAKPEANIKRYWQAIESHKRQLSQISS